MNNEFPFQNGELSLSPEQQEIVVSFGQGMAVLAGAGCGKTTTMVQKCKALLENRPNAKFIAVSFTEKSASDLNEKLSGFEGHLISTIHGLCASIIREFPRIVGLDGEERMLSAPEAEWLWQEACEVIWSDELPTKVQYSCEALLKNKTKTSLVALLNRVKDLKSFGVVKTLGNDLEILSHFVLSRYENSKRRMSVLDFDDLETFANQILMFDSVRKRYRSRYDFILVDEFQDTNPVQANLIWNLARERQHNLCVVGDPKQSIYRFRDADVSVFEEYCKTLPLQFVLSRNFRSRPGVINFINKICEKSFTAREMSYEPLVAAREEARSGASVEKIQMASPLEVGAWIKNEMAKGIPLQDMVLLLRRVRGSEKLLKSLATLGVPIVIGSGGFYWEDPRVRELVSFLKWWDQPGNSLSGAVFLRAPWVGISDLQLDEWVRQDPTWVEPFYSSGHPLAEVLQNFRSHPTRPGELLLQLLKIPQIEEELSSHLLQLWHRTEELSSQGFSFFEVVQELSRAMKEGRREREVPPPKGEGQLQVLTIHGAKGLEFPHVLLMDFPEKPLRSPNSPLLFWDRNLGSYLREDSGENEKRTPEEESWRQLERKKNLDESLRLFYVALTRARERLVLFTPPEIERIVSKKSPYEEDYWRAWVSESGELR